MIDIHAPWWLMLLFGTIGVIVGRVILDLIYAAYRKLKKRRAS
jgi:hypothetical protein